MERACCGLQPGADPLYRKLSMLSPDPLAGPLGVVRRAMALAPAAAVLGLGAILAVQTARLDAARSSLEKARRQSAAAAARAHQAEALVRRERAQVQASARIDHAFTRNETRLREVRKTLKEALPNHVLETDAADCSVPVGFVRLWNAANRSTALADVSDPAGRPDAAASGLGLVDVARAHIDDAQTYAEVAAQLSALQDWVRAQASLTQDPRTAPEGPAPRSDALQP